MAKRFKKVAVKYADDVISGKIIAGKEIVLACERFKNDLKRDDLELNTKMADLAINIMETTLVHAQGEDINGEPLLGKPFILEPWQVFIVYNLLGFYYKGTNERRYKEAFIEVGRKNGKTSLVAGLAWAMSIIERKSGSKCYIVANALKQTMEAFHFITFSLQYKKIADSFTIRDNSFNHQICYTFKNKDGTPDGSMEINAMPTNPDSQDSFNCNFAICDEVASYKKPAQYNRFKEASKAYTNKLTVGITTAGDNINSFGYKRQEYAIKVAGGVIEDDSLFSFVARADQNENGDVDYTNPIQHQKANPNYNITIRPKDMLQESLQAQNDPQQRKDFLSRSLNIYTTAMRSYFDLEEFKASDEMFDWSIEELSKLPITWFGGADLSKMHDLTACALYGNYEGVDIVITHAFFPVTQASKKADEDNIPLFGWKDDGWLTICNTPTVEVSDVVKWFISMREKGFNIKKVGHDKKFAREYMLEMQKAKFKIVDQPQYYYIKSEGFRRIEKSVKDKKFYYLHSEAFEYCVSNVHAIEKTDDMVQYEKVAKTQRIDIFDASVFACVQYLNSLTEKQKIKEWWGE